MKETSTMFRMSGWSLEASRSISPNERRDRELVIGTDGVHERAAQISHEHVRKHLVVIGEVLVEDGAERWYCVDKVKHRSDGGCRRRVAHGGKVRSRVAPRSGGRGERSLIR